MHKFIDLDQQVSYLISVPTETREITMKLTPVMETFIVHWGEMGSKWGVNRTVAQIFALLVLSEKPMNAEEIVETLSVARSNVSNSIKELQALGLVNLTHQLGDRRDHFEAIKDCWDMLLVLAQERKKREIDPTMQVLTQCLSTAEADKETPKYVTAQLKQMSEFMTTMDTWYIQMKSMDRKLMTRFFKLGSKIVSWLSKK